MLQELKKEWNDKAKDPKLSGILTEKTQDNKESENVDETTDPKDESKKTRRRRKITKWYEL